MLSEARFSEADVVSHITSFLAGDGYRVRTEVSNMGQSADMVATRNRWVTVIEVKLRDWKTAMRQCLAHEVVADFVCIAVAHVDPPDEMVAAATERGYGVIWYNRSGCCCEWVQRPMLNRAVWPPQRYEFSKRLRGVGYVG
ncbi:MAG: hypothetical protein AAF656_00490 [Planctomycetota bacterium]